MGHASPRAALIYQHATSDRDRVIADALGSMLAAASASELAQVRRVETTANGRHLGSRLSSRPLRPIWRPGVARLWHGALSPEPGNGTGPPKMASDQVFPGADDGTRTRDPHLGKPKPTPGQISI
jgi:hypothetical protein